jgi:conjugal transfer/type IV secretion protein DotA/TraY
MEFDELFVPPDLGDDYAAGVLTRLFGGIIPRLHGEGDGGVVVSNWLETIFTVFNTFCLLAMLVVLSYTIYAMVFDTAADGKTFGQAADTKYTILRMLAGVIGFVPVVGGFSLIQVAFLWLVLQGSALADVTWRRVADNMLSGTPLVSGTFNRVPPQALVQVRQFGSAFDTLVTGHLCGLNANRIERMLAGDEDIQIGEISTLGDEGAIRLRQTPVNTEDVSSGWESFNGRQVVGMSHQMFFGEEAGGAAYSGRDNYCGAVLSTDSYSALADGGGGIEVGLMASRAQQQFAHLGGTVLPDLSAAAYEVALMIYQGERDAETLRGPSRDAVYAAVASYLSGPAVATAINSDAVQDVHDSLLAMVSTEGWMMAPVWQRGVASTVTAIEMPGDTLEVNATRNNAVADFLAGRGYRVSRGDSTMRDLLAKADADQDTWDELAGYMLSLPLPDAATPLNVAMGSVDNGSLTQAGVNAMYQGLMNVFSPVATATGGGNFGFVDPMLQVQWQGQILSTAGAVGATGGALLSATNGAILGRVGDFMFGTGEVVGAVSGGLMTVGITLLIVGFIMMIVLPLVPMIYFYTAVISWLFQTLELMFSAPLLMLRLFMPAREGTLLGQDISRGLLAAFAVFMRPFFMIVGLVLAMMVISVALSYLHTLFGRLMFFDGIAGVSDPAVGDVAGMAGWIVDGAMGLVTMVFLLFVYVLLAFLTVLYGSQIISEFGEFAMNMIGAAASRYTQPSAIADKAVLAGGLGYMGARNIGMQIGRTANARVAGKLTKGAGGQGGSAPPRLTN